ncbi:MAG: thiamine pyrophosphate-dependent enzyme [Candidatus Hodarchaeota archaeon]
MTNELPKLHPQHYADDAHLVGVGWTSCAGCGQALAARLVLKAAGKNVIVTNGTGCLEVFSANFPQQSWRVPWFHSLFENSASVAAGIEAALRAEGKIEKIRVIAQGGDGGTADIGFGAISGMWERGHDILQICYDNGAYMNTGVQRSGLSPLYGSTTTSPAGKKSFGNPTRKKNLPEIAVAHGVPYVATATVGYQRDLINKVKKALEIRGPKYLQIYVPCPLGHRHATNLTMKLAKLAAQTGLYPLCEWEDGKRTKVRRFSEFKPVEEFLKPQRRFAHLFRPGAEEALSAVQEYANNMIEYYRLKR